MDRLANYFWGLDAALGALEDMNHDFDAEMASYAGDYYGDYY